VGNLLWEEEDELRHRCRVLWESLVQVQREKNKLVAEAYGYGFREGYATAVVRISCETQEGDAACPLLH